MIGNRPFIGTEVEGPAKGIQTLFIPNHSVKRESIPAILALVEKHKYRVYFGAGNITGMDPVCVDLASALINKHVTVVAEVQLGDLPVIESIYDREPSIQFIEFVLTIPLSYANPMLEKIEHIKLIDKQKLYWFSVGNIQLTQTDDPLYNEDKTIEL